MDLDESLATKIWLEENQATDNASYQLNYSVKHFHFEKKLENQIKTFLKINHFKWIDLIGSAWGLLLNRLSTTDFILFATGELQSPRTNHLKIHSDIHLIKSTIDEKVSVKQFIKKIKKQIAEKTTEDDIPEAVRYLLTWTKAKKSNKNHKTLSSNRFPLIAYFDQKKISTFKIFYHPTLLTEEKITQIFQHLTVLLDEISNNRSKTVIGLNILTEEESNKILKEWNQPIYDFKIAELKDCFHELFEQNAKNNPLQIALKHNQLIINYEELELVSHKIALELNANEVRTGDRVGVLMDRTPTLIASMLAIFKIGAIYVPVNPKYPDERIDYVLNNCEAKITLTNDLNLLPKTYRQKSLVIPADWNKLSFNDSHLSTTTFPKVNPETIAYIIYTSGTTGLPKGVTIKHKSLINFISWYQACFKVNQTDVASQFASQGFDTYLCEVVPFLALGAQVAIVDDNIKLTPSLFFEWIKENNVTVCDLPTTYAQILFTMTWPNPINLRLVKIGGESISRYPNQIFPFDIWNSYGPTEATIECTYCKIYIANTPPKTIIDHLPPPIGKPILHCEIYVVDKYFKPVPPGIGGEMLIGGVNLSPGYYNRPDLNVEKFIPHIINTNSQNKLYRTGDLVSWLPDGNLNFNGRIDHQVKIRGYRIELGDIENALHYYPDVNEAVVVVRENLRNEKNLVAYIVPNLDKERYLFQERCILSIDNNIFLEAVTNDISKGGAEITGLSGPIPKGNTYHLHVKLPGLNEAKIFSVHIIWQQDSRAGIAFDSNEAEKKIIEKSIEYYLSVHNVMDLVLSAASKRSLRKALRKKLPDYMIPNTFVTLMKFPLTFSGKVDLKNLPPPQEFEQTLQSTFIEPKTDTEKKLALIWSELLGRETISLTDNFFDLGGSSLTAAALSVKILQEFNTTVPTKVLFDLPYIKVIAECIDSHGKKYSTFSHTQEEIERDSKLQENIIPTKNLSKNLTNPKNILLTGAGGFLGIYLLRELLHSTNAKIYCLIRKGDFETAATRIMSTINKFQLNNDISLAEKRIVVIPSDLSFDNFGMPLEYYNSLLGKIDLIYHCGAQVNIMASYNNLRGSNVLGTLEVIKFATTKIDKPIHYISTLSSAYRKDENGNLSEEFPDQTYSEIFGGYAISKWVSERLLTEIKNRGLPVNIYRSGYIFGQSNNGVTSTNDALLMLIKGCIQLGFAPDLEEKITILPVDFVSHAIVSISLAFGEQSKVYHIDHPTGILWADLIAWINDYGYPIKIIPTKEWQSMLSTLPKDNALFPFLPFYLAMEQQKRSPEVNVDHATHALHEIGISYPDIDNNLLNIYFDYLCQVNFLPQTEILRSGIKEEKEKGEK